MENIFTIIAGDSPEEEYYVIVEQDDAESDQEKETNETYSGEETEEMKEIVGFLEIRCPYCFGWFLEEAQLMAHLKSHLAVQECLCIFCERCYQPSYFNKHIKRHFAKRFWTFDNNGGKICVDLDATDQRNDPKAKPKACKCCEKAKRKRVLWNQSKKSLKLPNPALWETPICIDPLDGSLC